MTKTPPRPFVFNRLFIQRELGGHIFQYLRKKLLSLHFRKSKNKGRRTVLLGFIVVQTMLGYCQSFAQDKYFEISETDLAFLPVYCRAKFVPKTRVEMKAHWEQVFGADNWLHMHHYCFGLKAIQSAYRDYGKPESRTYLSKQAANEFDYMLRHATPDFYLRPEILVQRGRALALARSYDAAKSSFNQALELEPKNVDAWTGLSDLYSQIGKKAEAIQVLEQAVQKAGHDHRKINVRLEDLKKTSPK